MAVDLFSLVMNLRTTGTANAAAELKGVESQGVKTAASLNGLSGTLDRTTSAALNNTKGFKDLSGAYAAQDATLKGVTASTTTAAVATESLGSKLKGFALLAVDVALVGAAVGAVTGFLFESARASAEAEQVQVRLRTAVRGAGLDWSTYGEQLTSTSVALQNQTTFTDEEAKEALAKLVIATRDAGQAQQLLGVAADLAAFKHISLSSATEIVTRALSGYTRGLREFGITTKDGTEAVAQLGALLSGQAAAQAGTFDGRIKQLTNSWGEFKEQIGRVIINSGLVEYLQFLNQSLTGINRILDSIRGKGGIADQSTPALTARLKDLRAAQTGQAPSFLSGIGGTIAPLTGDALEKNRKEQIAIQNELLEREKAHALQVTLDANKQLDADDKHVQALAEGYKLGTLSSADNAERLETVKKLRAEMVGANLEERNHLQTVINSLTPKLESLEARWGRLVAMIGGGPVAPDRLDAGPLPGGNPSLRGPLNLPDVITAVPGGRGRGNTEDNAGYRAILQAGQSVKDQFATLGTNLGMTLANAFSAAVGAAAKGGNFFQSFGRAVLAGLGNIFVQMGSAMVMASPLFVALNNAMKNPFTSGFALLGIGVALMALGTVLGGIAQGGGGGGGGAGSSAPKDTTTRITLTADGAGGATAPGQQPAQHFTVLGVNTPMGQRVLATAQTAAKRRGF